MGERFDDESELKDADRDDIGIVKVLRIVFEVRGLLSFIGNDLGDSCGISSGAGIGRPRAAATSWFSVHELECSFKPRQNGAIRRSIYHD